MVGGAKRGGMTGDEGSGTLSSSVKATLVVAALLGLFFLGLVAISYL